LIRDAPEQLGMMGYFSHESSLLTTVIIRENGGVLCYRNACNKLLEQLDKLDGTYEAQDLAFMKLRIAVADNRSALGKDTEALGG
jgi:hypothetical protein